MDLMTYEMQQIRQLIERMISVEERQSSHDQALLRMGKRIDDIETSSGEIERQLSRNSWTIGAVERIWWILVTSAVGAIGYLIHIGWGKSG